MSVFLQREASGFLKSVEMAYEWEILKKEGRGYQIRWWDSCEMGITFTKKVIHHFLRKRGNG